MKTETGLRITARMEGVELDRTGVTLSASAGLQGLPMWIALDMTASEARELAAELIAAANLAEGGKA